MPLDAPPVVRTYTLRYDFQVEVCEDHPGTILNIGCNEDPAQLQARFGSRIVNCDMEAWDHHMDRGNVVDRVFNCLEFPWPFDYQSAELVLLGDIMEHFTREAMVEVLRECARVAQKVAITVPEDTRIDERQQHEVWEREAYNLHTTVVTRDLLTGVLHSTGWSAERFVEGMWGFDGIKGFCVLASRG
jgi:predicted SAM-dependent methyltransferase